MKSIVKEKSYNFALRIVKLYKHLIEVKKEFVLSKQLLRCGTSIGANVEEALGGQSDKDFIAKISIAYKESRETNYWLRLLKDSDYLNKIEFESIIMDCEEIEKILSSILLTMKNKINS
ncbi:MAG: four helix bundle protein [Ignavibacteria bacterium]|nr:four helix bundle protein [Ignavibacteria bacterium]